ncbi:MAG TPA: hypothetical protein VEJ47_18980 [Candidatus Eremiobacteraceae bacterium]|nr:hypothetical protein [Candidatus Eremiobacteraceae bacterium]
MKELPEVRDAKELMNQAMDWSSFRWLFEKSRVREIADRANAALDRLNRNIKARWSSEAKELYKELSASKSAPREHENSDEATSPRELAAFLQKVIEADEAARKARRNAEDTFDEAERQMSTTLAKEGCKKAIRSWELHEKAIRRAKEVELASDSQA